MEHKKDRRGRERTYIEPYDTGIFIEFTLTGTSYRLTLLDTSPDGIGMLVKKEDVSILETLKIGDRIKVEYCTTDIKIPMNFEIKHFTKITRGAFKGHHQVGFVNITGSDLGLMD